VFCTDESHCELEYLACSRMLAPREERGQR
jgi:hypothetical protein